MERILLTLLLACTLATAQATAVLYTKDFEHPTGFVDDGGHVNIFRTIDLLSGGCAAMDTSASPPATKPAMSARCPSRRRWHWWAGPCSA